MRGKLDSLSHNHVQTRITPADAGKTQFLMLAPRRDQDHPRGCGENATRGFRVRGRLGSPPRMRGKLTINGVNANKCRITPADAGKTKLYPI